MIFADEDSDIAESYSSSGTDSEEERTSTQNEDITPMVSEDSVILQPLEYLLVSCPVANSDQYEGMSDESSDDEQGECSTRSGGRGREKSSRGARVGGAGSEKGVRRGFRGGGGRVGRGRGRGGRGGIRVRGGGKMAERRQARIRDEIYLEEKWVITDQPFQIPPFTAPAGIQVPIPPNAKAIDFFNLFVVDEIMELISEQTKLYAEQYKENNDEKSL